MKFVPEVQKLLINFRIIDLCWHRGFGAVLDVTPVGCGDALFKINTPQLQAPISSPN